jgi:hypothetical protein
MQDIAAQPCSYIYPIYSVVKNRLRQRLVAATRSGARLRQAQGSESLRRESQPRAGLLRNTFIRDGGADRDRTDDILLAKQALSQLSYSPVSSL